MDEPKYFRPYGNNPYRGYDSSTRPFLFKGEFPPHGIEPLGTCGARGQSRLATQPIFGWDQRD